MVYRLRWVSRMSLRTVVFGRPLRTEAEADEKIGVVQGVPVLGLDALASAAYGPEAALTVLIVAGAAASQYLLPVIGCIIALLILVFLSYRQTIGAYPGGGGAAVAISAGVGALVSAVPSLLPYTLRLCLALLLLLTTINLRGIRSTGLIFMAPTYLFVATLAVAIGWGLLATIQSGGHPSPAAALPRAPSDAAVAVGLWLFLRAFASGCTAMTGIEAVSNAVPLFRRPSVRVARHTLTFIVCILVMLLAGLGVLVRAYGVTATPPGQAGFESVLSQVVAAVSGRGAYYYVTMTAVLLVLAFSANTSFADFPRVCRVLAADRYLPAEFARRGSRLVFTNGIVVLALLAALLLIVFKGITDHLIPLFAIGALLAFTMSQLGMVAHWQRSTEPNRLPRLILNALGATATAMALLIVIVSKFTHGAWITAIVIPGFVILFRSMKQYNDRLTDITRTAGAPTMVSIPRQPSRHPAEGPVADERRPARLGHVDAVVSGFEAGRRRVTSLGRPISPHPAG
jgi:amino acid transporter